LLLTKHDWHPLQDVNKKMQFLSQFVRSIKNHDVNHIDW